jgi:hemolysin activation/secretion protein
VTKYCFLRGCLPLVLITPIAFGQASPLDFQRIAPKTPPRLQESATLPAPEKANFTDATPVLDNLKGIVLLSEAGQVHPNGWPGVTTVKSEGEGLIASPQLAARLTPFLGKPATFGKLQEICAEIVRFYRDKNRPVVDAQLPEQNVTNGVVQILVVEGRVGRILAEDQRWFSESRILRGIRSKVGDFIEANRLLDDLNWLNRNPFRRSELLFRKGESHGQTDIVVKTSDRFPLRPYFAYDNYGTDLTGNHRLQAGMIWGDAFGLDQTLAYQFTVAPDPEAFIAHAATWTIPLPWRHVLELYGSYARSKPTDGSVKFDAESLQLGILYTIPLPSIRSIKHEVSFGIEFKEANNDLLFGGTNIFASSSDIFQYRLSYLARQADSSGSTSTQASVYYSPGGVTDENTDEAFQKGRPFAEADYFYGRVTIQRTQKLPWNLSAVATVAGQLSSANLLASEQFSLGGGTTVRGYEESVANGDRGWLASLEIYSPPLVVLRRLRPEAPEDELKFVVFVDAGGVANVDRLPEERSYQGVAGVGAGLRYRINTRFNLRFDYAWSLMEIPGLEIDDSRAYVSASLSY